MSLYLIDDTNLIDVSLFGSKTSITFYPNDDGSYTFKKSSASRQSRIVTVNLEPGVYTVSFDVTEINYLNTNSSLLGIEIKYDDGKGITSALFNASDAVGIVTKTITLTKRAVSMQLYMASSQTNDSYITFKDFMLNAGPTAKPFRPYRNPVKLQAMELRDWDCTEVSGSFTDRSTANGLDIIDGKNARLDKIGGSTVRDENLFPFPYNPNGRTYSQTNSGVTLSVNDDATIVINGTPDETVTTYVQFTLVWAAANAPHINTTIGSTYTVSGCPSGGDKNTYCLIVQDAAYKSVQNEYGSGVTFAATADQYNAAIRIYAGYTANNLVFKPMVNKGSTALSWKPRFQGLKNSSFKGLKSVGKNLIPFPYPEELRGAGTIISKGGITATVQEDGGVYFKGTAQSSGAVFFNLMRKRISEKTFSTGYNSLTTSDGAIRLSKSGSTSNVTLAFNSANNTTYFAIRAGSTVDGIVYAMLHYGDTSLPYEPYKESLYELPEGIELGQWDSFDPKTGELTVGTGYYTLTGNESCEAGDNDIKIDCLRNKQAASDDLAILCVCNLLQSNTRNSVSYGGRGISVKASRIIVSNKDFPTIADWQTYAKAQYDKGDPIIVAYKVGKSYVQTIKYEDTPKRFYTAWNGGRETLMPGTEDNSIYGAIPTVTATYKAKTDEEIVVLKDIKIKESNIE